MSSEVFLAAATTSEIPQYTSPISIKPGLQVSSSKAIIAHTSKHHQHMLQNPKIKKWILLHSKSSAGRALSFTRAVRATLRAEEDLALMRINETEEYLGLLREKMAMIQTQVAEADEQIDQVREVLCSSGIAEDSHSDEDSTSASSPPHSSNYLCPEHLTDIELDHGSDTDVKGEHNSFSGTLPSSMSGSKEIDSGLAGQGVQVELV